MSNKDTATLVWRAFDAALAAANAANAALDAARDAAREFPISLAKGTFVELGCTGPQRRSNGVTHTTENARPIIDDLELPIRGPKLDGPAVHAQVGYTYRERDPLPQPWGSPTGGP